MYCVEISARIIRWPGACACCCRRADTTLEISSTRVTGKKVIHTHTKSWVVPYCRKCLAHIQTSRELKRFSMFVLHLSVVFGLVGVAVALLLLFVFIQISTPLAICLSLLAAATTIAVIATTFRWCREKYEREVQAKRRGRRELEDRLAALLSPSCAAEGRAADYDGWYGSIHTFYFSNAEFAALVEEANRGKCLRSGRIHHGRMVEPNRHKALGVK
jgi:hypothetical protein